MCEQLYVDSPGRHEQLFEVVCTVDPRKPGPLVARSPTEDTIFGARTSAKLSGTVPFETTDAAKKTRVTLSWLRGRLAHGAFNEP